MSAYSTPISSKGQKTSTTGKKDDGAAEKRHQGGKAVRYLMTAMPYRSQMPGMVLGAMELCAYFPNHTQRPRVLFRLLRHGFRAKTIAEALLHPRGELNKDKLKCLNESLRQRIGTAGKAYYNDENWTMLDWLRTSHTDSLPFPSNGVYPQRYDISKDDANWESGHAIGWNPHKCEEDTDNPTLLEISQGVVHLPTGQDAGLLTQVIAYGRAKSGPFWLQSHTLRDIPAIVAAHGFKLPSEASSHEWDVKALERLHANVAEAMA